MSERAIDNRSSDQERLLLTVSNDVRISGKIEQCTTIELIRDKRPEWLNGQHPIYIIDMQNDDYYADNKPFTKKDVINYKRLLRKEN